MATRLDLIIRGGTVLDGKGGEGVVADVGVRDGLIAEIGAIAGSATEEIDSHGKVVTPGFVDIHTHYDGQVVWDDTVAPSSSHGVTTVVIGNCGVGFAPCRPDDRDSLIALMEGVEDIPAPVMNEGLDWSWESFPEYLDALASRTWDVDVCALVPHAPIRVYVMGERALRLEPATPPDIEKMRAIVAEAIRAGAFGVSSSRASAHRSLKGDITPTVTARERELSGLMIGMQDAQRGFFELVLEANDPDVLGEYEIVRRALERTEQSGVFSLTQDAGLPNLFRDVMKFADECIADGIAFRPVVAPRAVGVLFGLEGSQNPFSGTATYRTLMHLPLAERVAILRKPEIRAQILSEDPMEHSTFPLMGRIPHSNMYRFGNPPNYTPGPADSLAAIAAQQGRTVPEVAYDMMLEHDGMAFIYVPFNNYASGDLSACEEMLANPNTVMGLGDGGAHAGFILDAGFPTWLLTYWVRDRGRFSLAEGIRRLTSDTAGVVGLVDRGRIAVGLRADLNVIDVDQLGFGPPYVTYDLPAGGRRIGQRATGYEATVVAGEVTQRDGVATGARPGKLVRSGSVAERRSSGS